MPTWWCRHHLSICSNAWSAYFSLSPGYMCKRSSFLKHQTISSHTDRAHKLKVGYFDMEIVSTLSGPPTPSIKSVNRESDLCSDRSHFLNHTDPSNGASVIWCWNPWNCTRGKEDQQDETLASLATQLPQCRGGHLSH